MSLNREDILPQIAEYREEMKGKFGYARVNTSYRKLVKQAWQEGLYSKSEYDAALRYDKVARQYQQAKSYQQQQADPNFKQIPFDSGHAQAGMPVQSILYTPKNPEADIILKPSSQIKADEFGTQYKLKQALPTYSLVSEFTDREVALKSQPDMTTDARDRITSGQEQRIENLLEREKRLQNFINFGGVLKKDENKSDWSLGEIGKTIARKPLEMGSAPVFIGGRVALAGDLLTSQRGRQELGEAFARVPPALAKAYDPRKPSGLINIGLTATSIYSIGKARATARQEMKFSTEGIATKRINTKTNIIDQSKGRVEVLFGKKKITGEIKTNEVFYKQTDVKYFSEGSGTIKYTLPSGRSKTIAFDTRGQSYVQPKGVDSLTIAKITKNAVKGNKFYLTGTKTQSITTNPLQSFRSISATKIYSSKATDFFSGKDYTVSTGITTEAIRVPIYTESGKLLSTEQILNTGRISIGSSTLGKNYVFVQPKNNINSLVKTSKTLFESKTAASGSGGFNVELASIPKKTTVINTIPKTVSAQSGINLGLTQLKSLAQGIQTSQIKGYSTTGVVALSGVQTGFKSQINPIQSKRLSMSLIDRQYQPSAIKPISAQKPMPITASKPISIPITAISPQSLTVQNIQPVQITELRSLTVSQTQPISPSITPVPTPTINPPIIFGGLGLMMPSGMLSSSKPRKAKRTAFNTKYVPSLEAELFNIKGKPSKIAALSGIGIRKITKTGGI